MGGEVRAASPVLAAGRASAADRAALDAEAANVCSREPCCALYHRAVELIGKRWTGAIILVLMEGPLRFSEVKRLVPQLSDRLLSERLKELEAEGIVERREVDHSPTRVEYALTPKGQALEPVVRALKRWAHAWL